VDRIDVAQDRDQWHGVLNMVNLWVPQKVGNFLSSRMTVSFSRRTLDSRIGGSDRQLFVCLFVCLLVEKKYIWNKSILDGIFEGT
jgi:hypothetical protein